MTKTPWMFLAASTLAMTTSATWAATGATPCAAIQNQGSHPTFCSIPATPTNVRSADAFRAAVVDVRQAGLRLNSAIAREPVSLPIGDAENFAGLARAKAMLPGAATAVPDTEAFEADARRRLGAPHSKPRP